MNTGKLVKTGRLMSPIAVITPAVDVWIVFAFRPYSGFPSVAGINYRIIRQLHQFGDNASNQLGAAAAWHHSGTDTAPEQCIPGKNFTGCVEGNTTRCVPGGVNYR